MADAHPLDNFSLSQYKRKDRNNMEIENLWTKSCRLNANDYDKIKMYEFCDRVFPNLILINPGTLVSSIILCDDYWLFSFLIC
jgi:hypothetical protein